MAALTAISGLPMLAKRVLAHAIDRMELLRLHVLERTASPDPLARIASIGIEHPRLIARVRARRARAVAAVYQRHATIVSDDDAIAIIAALARTGQEGAAKSVIISRAKTNETSCADMARSVVSHIVLHAPASASASDQTTLATLCRLLSHFGAPRDAADMLAVAYARGARPVTGLLAVLEHHWRAKEYDEAHALALSLAPYEPLVASYYDVYHAIRRHPERDARGGATDLLAQAEAAGDTAAISHVHLLVFDVYLRWAPPEDALAFFHQHRGRILSETPRAAELAAGLVKRLADAGASNDAVRLVDDLEKQGPRAIFRPCFRLRVAETAIATRLRSGATMSPPGVMQAHTLYRDHADNPFNLALGEAWQALYAAASKRAPCYFDVRVDGGEREALIAHLANTLRRKQPLSAIRIGDGESYGFGAQGIEAAPDALRAPLLAHRAQIFGADREALERIWWGRPVSPTFRAALQRRFQEAVRAADIIGAPNIYRLCRDARPGAPFYETRQGRGLSHALVETAELINSRSLAPSVTDERFNHLLTSDVIASLCAEAVRTIIIGPYSEDTLRTALTCATRPRVIQIPPQTNIRDAVRAGAGELGAKTVPAPSFSPARSILPDIIDEVTALAREAAGPGVLVLIGAGIWGKILADEARRAGAVGIDIGAAIDYLVGVRSRNTLDTEQQTKNQTEALKSNTS